MIFLNAIGVCAREKARLEGNALKKFICLLTAVIMIICAFALSACNPANSGDSSDDGATADVDFNEGDKKIVTNYKVELVSGTDKTWAEYTEDGETVLIFSSLTADSVYKITGSVAGCVVLDGGDEHKIELELSGFTVSSEKNCPISALSGDKVTLTAKKGTKNFVYDRRGDVSTVSGQKSVAIFSETDLTFGGQGTLTVVSDANGGVHTKDDLEIKKLVLNVKSSDCALKGNDSVTVTSGALTLVSTKGDGIKTSSSDVSSKGKQRGTIIFAGGTTDVYSAGDGIDAAYDVNVSGAASVKVYTDKYSSYSEEVTAVDDDSYYIRTISSSYNYSIMYFNSDSDVVWKDAEYYLYTVSVNASGKVKTIYYYKADRLPGYDRFRVYAYKASQSQGQASDFVARSDGKAQNADYDTIQVSVVGNDLTTSWSNFTTAGVADGSHIPAEVAEGSTDRGDHSSKGIKADNAITIFGGTVKVVAYDDAIHADNGDDLDSGAEALGDVTISGGTVEVYSNDDGIHADGILTVSGGTVSVLKSYEGAEGCNVVVSGGIFSVTASDDGLNGSAPAGTAIRVSGGKLYVFAGGDGIDSNSKTSGSGIIFEGGCTAVVSTSSNNSCIDSEGGYSYVGGYVLGVCPSGMTGEATAVNYTSGYLLTERGLSITAGSYVTAGNVVSLKIPTAISDGFAIYIGEKNADAISVVSAPIGAQDNNGVCWKI